MKRESDCSTTSSWRKPRSSETASFACRIFPSRSDTNTGSGAFLMMMSAAMAPRAAPFSVALAPCRPPAGGFKTFLAMAFLRVWAMPGGCGLIVRKNPCAGKAKFLQTPLELPVGCFFLGGSLGGRDRLEPLIRDRLPAFDREPVGAGRKACLGPLDGLELPAQIV